MRYSLGTKFLLATAIFGMGFLDPTYNPLGTVENAVSAAVVVIVIFFGDVMAAWVKSRLRKE
jgi:hypothetical protein